MNRNGVGHFYHPTYRDKKTGEIKESAIWWISYTHRGIRYRESSKSDVKQVAKDLLKDRLGRAGLLNKPVTSAIRKTTLDDLYKLIVADYTDNQYDTLARQEDAFVHLRAFFGGDCLSDDIVRQIPDYKIWRREQPDSRSLKRTGAVKYAHEPRVGCSVATLNREMSALRRAFTLASQATPPLVATMPFIKLAKENNRRTGFFEREQFEQVRERLPDYLKPVMTVAYYTGWRPPSEICTRQPRHVINDMLILEAGEGKSGEPRRFPLDILPELREVIEQQLAAAHARSVETGAVSQWLFPGAHGDRIVDYLPAWHKACEAAGVKRIPHDFRRTAFRNLIDAGVDPFTAMELVGWSMLKRYRIVNEKTLRDGVAKLAAKIEADKAAQKAKGSKVVSIHG